MAFQVEDPEARTLLDLQEFAEPPRRRNLGRLALGAVAALAACGAAATVSRQASSEHAAVAATSTQSVSIRESVGLFQAEFQAKNPDVFRNLTGGALGFNALQVIPPLKPLCDKCKRPLETTFPSDSGGQCQWKIFKNRATIVSINLLMSKRNIKKIDADPKKSRDDPVPCDIVINYGQADEMLFTGAECGYKGNTGSFMGCLKRDDSSDQGGESCRMMSRKVKLSKAVRKSDGKKAKKVLGLSKLNLHGSQNDDSLSREYLAYKVLRDHLNIPASCAEPANLFINGQYQGVVTMIEPVDGEFTEKRFKSDPNDPLHGSGTLWKEMWPECSLPTFYKFAKPIDDFAAREMVQEGTDGPHYDLFANLHRESLACQKSGKLCTPSRASQILDKYVWADSFIDAFVGISLTGNSDQPFMLLHNFFFYVMGGKFYYLPWDYNQVWSDITGSPIPGYAIPYPWYRRLTEDERNKVCPYPVPSNHSDLSQRRFAHLNCDPVGFVMGVAWKRRFEAKWKAIDHPGLVAAVKKESVMYNVKIASSIKCGAENGGWPPSIKEQEDEACRVNAVLDKTVGFNKAVAEGSLARWPTPTYDDFPYQVGKCLLDAVQAAQYLGQAGLQLTLAVQDCPHTPNGISACTADISYVIASFSFVASFISAMLSECPVQDSAGFAQRGIGELYDTAPQAECAAMASRIVAGLASVSAGAGGLSEMCLPGKASANRGLDSSSQESVRQESGRRLMSTGFVQDRAMEKATCTFDVLGASFWLGLAAMAIQESSQTCTRFFGVGAVCSRSVFAVVEAFSYVGMFLAEAVAQCAEEAHFPMDKVWEISCAADIQQLIGGLSSIGVGGSGVAVSCGEYGKAGYHLKNKPSWRHLTPEQYLKELEESTGALGDLVRGNTDKLSAWIGKHSNITTNPAALG